MDRPRLRFSFSLRTLLIVLTAFACWLGWNANVVRHRRALLEWSRERGCAIGTRQDLRETVFALRAVGAYEGNLTPFDSVPDVSLVRRLLGDEAIARFEFSAPELDFFGEQLLSPDEHGPAPDTKTDPLPADKKADLRQWFPEALFDYAAPKWSSERSTYAEEAAQWPERISLPLIGRSAARP